MTKIIETTMVIDTHKSAENFRARVHRMPDGVLVTIPIRDGSRGSLYTSTLTTTKHGKLRTTTKHIHLSFDIPISEGLTYAGHCVQDEVEHFIDYMLSNNI